MNKVLTVLHEVAEHTIIMCAFTFAMHAAAIRA